MDPGIGPSGAVDRLADPAVQAGQRGLELPLDGARSRLQLEARELRAVVFDRCSEPPDGGSRSAGALASLLVVVAGPAERRRLLLFELP